MTAPAISVILPERRYPERLGRSVQSLLAQSVRSEIIGVVPPEQRAAALKHAPGLDVLIEVSASRWTLGRALNAGAAAAVAPVHATITPGHQLPRSDWCARLLANLNHHEVAAAAGLGVDRTGKSLLRRLTIRAADWEPGWGFSTSAAGWKAAEWAREPFDEDVTAAADRIWAWKMLRRGAVIVVDPFLALDQPPLRRPTAWSIFCRSAAEWKSFVDAGAPVTPPSLTQAVASWWIGIEKSSPTPAALQRLNYFRLSRALGSWAGGLGARK